MLCCTSFHSVRLKEGTRHAESGEYEIRNGKRVFIIRGYFGHITPKVIFLEFNRVIFNLIADDNIFRHYSGWFSYNGVRIRSHRLPWNSRWYWRNWFSTRYWWRRMRSVHRQLLHRSKIVDAHGGMKVHQQRNAQIILFFFPLKQSIYIW